MLCKLCKLCKLVGCLHPHMSLLLPPPPPFPPWGLQCFDERAGGVGGCAAETFEDNDEDKGIREVENDYSRFEIQSLTFWLKDTINEDNGIRTLMLINEHHSLPYLFPLSPPPPRSWAWPRPCLRPGPWHRWSCLSGGRHRGYQGPRGFPRGGRPVPAGVKLEDLWITNRQRKEKPKSPPSSIDCVLFAWCSHG